MVIHNHPRMTSSYLATGVLYKPFVRFGAFARNEALLVRCRGVARTRRLGDAVARKQSGGEWLEFLSLPSIRGT